MNSYARPGAAVAPRLVHWFAFVLVTSAFALNGAAGKILV